LIIKKIDKIREGLNNDTLNASDSIFIEFERIWIKYYADAVNNIREYLPENYEDEYLTRKTFLEVRDLLVSAINGIEVKAVNTVEKDVLDYESGEKKYIVIGGNKLSRGFTLEGLTINYFIRNTNFADTLLQMGRWFGYRPGYLDCCKLFTTADTFEKFDQCTWTIEELEEEFRKLSIAKKKPKDYATKVLTHPGTLQITRPAILKNAVVEKWSFEDSLIQTTELKVTKENIEKSWSNFKNICQKHKERFIVDKDKKIISFKTDTDGFVEFLNSQQTYTEKFLKDELIRFVKLSNQYEKLTNWTIVIKTSGSSNTLLPKEDTGFLEVVQLSIRSSSKREPYYTKLLTENIFKVSGASSNIISGGTDMSFTLSESEISKIKDEFNKIKPDKNPPENVFREKMNDSDGLLVIFLMDLEAVFNDDELIKKATNESINLSTPLIGFAIGIPPLKANIAGEYLVNKHILENIKNNPQVEEEFEFEEVDDEYEGFDTD